MVAKGAKLSCWPLSLCNYKKKLQIALYSLKNGVSAVSEPDAKESYANPYIDFLTDSYYHWWF